MTQSVFKRKIYQQMLVWKQNRAGRSALLIQGARRVGKSTIIRHFAEKEYKSYAIIDFSNASAEMNNLFSDMSDLNYFFLRLQVLSHVTLYERQSLIVFDEVQLQPLARQAIKHLVADGRYDYIETGSLISIRKNVKDIVIPSEEYSISMFPMDYEEFLWALGDEVTMPLLRKFYEKHYPLGNAHRKAMRDFRLYILIGGMPQAVAEYIATNNMEKVDEVKREIIDLYEMDFRRIDVSGRASLIFDAIPSQLGKNASRYKISSVVKNGKHDRMEEIIADLRDSMTVNISYRVNDPNVGMALTKDISHYKLFLSDTGLFVTLAFKDKAFTENIVYQKLLSDKLSTNLGYVYENVVAQMLVANGNELFYYTFPAENNSNHNYEIDFLLARKNKICPVEVKSSGYKNHASIDAFVKKYSSRIAEKYLIYTKDLQKESDMIYVPAYMTPLL